MVKVLKLNEEEIFKLGKDVIKLSPVVKVFLKYFITIDKTINEASKTWKKHFSHGKIEIVKINKKDREIIIRLKELKRHPLTCIYDQGVFIGILEMITGCKNSIIKETKCMHKGDPFHEFKVNWS